MLKTWFSAVLIFFTTTNIFSQRAPMPSGSEMPKNGTITGIVIDKDINRPVEYANIALFSMKDSSLVTGIVTDPEGRFTLKKLNWGRYYMSVKFIGYNSETIKDIRLTPRNKVTDVGKIFLKQSRVALDGVEVTAEKAPVIYKIDRKVVDPTQFATASGGTAVDVLEQTPSVTVDAEGNVSLRGSTNFTVLIDGRPSPFSGSDALQQIPTGSIENIEIITNPSAKYDPEGTAGIINIISKKSKLSGMTGIVNTNVGNHDNYGGDFLLNYRTDKFNVYAGANYNHRNFPGSRSIENITYTGNKAAGTDTARYVFSEGDASFLRETKGIKTGIDLFLNNKTTLSTGISIGERSMGRTGELKYKEWTKPASTTNSYTGNIGFGRGGNYISTNAALTHKFDNSGHELKLDAIYKYSEQDEFSYTEQYADNDLNTFSDGKKSEGVEKEKEWRLKADYTLPINEKLKLEAGWQSRIESEEGDNTTYFRLDEWEVQDNYSYQTSSDINIHSAYSTFAAELGKFGIQGGLRAELTDRSIKNVESGEEFGLNRWDFFPSVHTSYQISNTLQAMTSYTRRINRPRGHYLEPYEHYMDPYNIRAGNPDLNPEYIDSYELGISKRKGASFLSIETYYRIRDNKIERIRTPYQNSNTIMYNTRANVGKDYSLGTEIMLNIKPVKFWTLNLSGNLYNYKVEGELYGKSFDKESFNWNSRIGNTFTISPTTRLQLDGMYYSKSVTAQGESKDFFVTNAALKQEFFNRKLTATLQVRDLLNSMTHNIITEGPSYKSTIKIDRSSQMINLTLSYKINNYRINKKNNKNNGNGEMDSGDIF